MNMTYSQWRSLDMVNVRLYFLIKPDPNHPIEQRYMVELNETRKSFYNKEDALLYLFDNGIRTFQYLTKELAEYKNVDKQPLYEFWHLENRVGYVLYDYEQYPDENGQLRKRKAFVWRFVGFGRSCFAETREELRLKVLSLINEYREDNEGRGFNIYPAYTKHYR